MILFVRHGERADQSHDYKEYKNIEKQYDPHLTKVGIEQALRTGQTLKNIIGQVGDKKVICMSSPFIRCLTTARQICEQLGVKQIYIQEEISELMYSYDFKSNILGDLHYRKQTPLSKKYLDGIEIIPQKYFSDVSLIQPTWPENSKACEKRIYPFIDKLFQKLQQEQFIYICVTHQGVLELAMAKFGTNYDYIDFCGVTQIIEKENKPVVGINGKCFWK